MDTWNTVTPTTQRRKRPAGKTIVFGIGRNQPPIEYMYGIPIPLDTPPPSPPPHREDDVGDATSTANVTNKLSTIGIDKESIIPIENEPAASAPDTTHSNKPHVNISQEDDKDDKPGDSDDSSIDPQERKEDPTKKPASASLQLLLQQPTSMYDRIKQKQASAETTATASSQKLTQKTKSSTTGTQTQTKINKASSNGQDSSPAKPLYQVGQMFLGQDPRCGRHYPAVIRDGKLYTDPSAGTAHWRYLLHFKGWKTTWDTWVTADALVPDTPANREKVEEQKKRPRQEPSASTHKLPKSKKGKMAKSELVKQEGGQAGTARESAKMVFSGLPDEPLPGGWPDGWTKKVFQRASGESKGHTDRYWFTPINQFKLRSMVEVNKFMQALEQTNGDEVAAKKIFKSVILVTK